MEFVLLSNIFTIPPENSDDNEDVANSPDNGDKTIEQEEDHLHFRLKDELLVRVAIIGVTGGQVGHVAGQFRQLVCGEKGPHGYFINAVSS